MGAYSPLPWLDERFGSEGAFVDEVTRTVAEPVPMNLRNAPTRLMKDFGYGHGYQHAHEFEGAVNQMECLPESLAGRQYYVPSARGAEKQIAERLDDRFRLLTGASRTVCSPWAGSAMSNTLTTARARMSVPLWLPCWGWVQSAGSW